MDGSGSLLIAQRGKGTWLSPLVGGQQFDQVHVSARQDITQARLLRSFESGHTNVDKIENLIKNLDIQTQAVRMDSQAKYAVLACGYGELVMRLISPSMPDYREKIWDQAAGSIIVEEAGGRISDLRGKALDFHTGRILANNRGVIASNGYLHPITLNALAGVGA
jgi:3'(2'), 5'-bisphosphate nucleotidase